MSIRLVGEWLEGFGVEGFDGACSFTYRDTIDLTVEVTADESSVVLYSTVGQVPPVAEAKFFERLLRMNYLGVATQGATLSVDEIGNVVLWISLPIETLDIAKFEQVMGTFLDLTEEITEAAVSASS